MSSLVQLVYIWFMGRVFAIVNELARLLQHPRIRALVNLQCVNGDTALHRVCTRRQDATLVMSIVHLVLQAGANPALTNNQGQTPLAWIQGDSPSHLTTITFLEQGPDAEKSWLLIKARRFVVGAVALLPAKPCGAGPALAACGANADRG